MSCFICRLPKALISSSLIDEGGDWDRRNRLKVYNGVHLLSIRQFKRGAELLLDALSTFTATELVSYNDFVALTVIANTLTLKRVDLKKKVRSKFMSYFPKLTALQIISAPEVNQVLPELPVLGDLVKSLYDCHYDKFFLALGKSSYIGALLQAHLAQLLSNKRTSSHRAFWHLTRDSTCERCASSHTCSYLSRIEA